MLKIKIKVRDKMKKIEIEQMKHNEGARLLNIVVPKALDILSKYINKKLVKVDHSLVAKIKDEFTLLNQSLEQRDNCYINIRFAGIVELRTRTSFKINDSWVYAEDYASIGKLDEDSNILIELFTIDKFKDDNRFIKVNKEEENNQYNEAYTKAKEFMDYYESLDYRIKQQLQDDFYRLK